MKRFLVGVILPFTALVSFMVMLITAVIGSIWMPVVCFAVFILAILTMGAFEGDC